MADHDTLLLEIFERLGSIDARLDAGNEKHEEFTRELKLVKEKIEPLPMIASTVEHMKPIVDDYLQSRSKMAGVMLACTTLAGGIGFFASEIKKAIFGH